MAKCKEENFKNWFSSVKYSTVWIPASILSFVTVKKVNSIFWASVSPTGKLGNWSFLRNVLGMVINLDNVFQAYVGISETW